MSYSLCYPQCSAVHIKGILLLEQVIVGTLGHGRLLDPPGRNTMWRQGFDNPVNYNDDEVYCGGFGGKAKR